MAFAKRGMPASPEPGESERDSAGHFRGCVDYGCGLTDCATVRRMFGNPSHNYGGWYWREERGVDASKDGGE